MPQKKYTPVVKMFNKKHDNKNICLCPFSRVFSVSKLMFVRELVSKVSASHRFIGYGDTSGALQSCNGIYREYAVSLLKRTCCCEKTCWFWFHTCWYFRPLLVCTGRVMQENTCLSFHSTHWPAQGREELQGLWCSCKTQNCTGQSIS